jgi:hypothetical protein
MELEQRVHFRDEFRAARVAVLKDAEEFDQIVFVIERLGQFILGRTAALADYEPAITEFVQISALTSAAPERFPELHSAFSPLYTIVRRARNDALHIGAFARHLAARATELALIIEDALTQDMTTVGHIMVRGPVCASPWFPLSFARQLLLANSFSFLPIRIAMDGEKRWRLLSDYALGSYLRSSPTEAERKRRLCQTLQDAVAQGAIRCETPFACQATTSLEEALRGSNGLPVLIVDRNGEELLGIATPFDFL